MLLNIVLSSLDSYRDLLNARAADISVLIKRQGIIKDRKVIGS